MTKNRERPVKIVLRLLQLLDCLAAKSSKLFTFAQARKWAREGGEPLKGASEQTLRRDLQVLCQAGLLNVEREANGGGCRYSFLRGIRLQSPAKAGRINATADWLRAARKLLPVELMEDHREGSDEGGEFIEVFAPEITPKIEDSILLAAYEALERGCLLSVDYGRKTEPAAQRILAPWALWWVPLDLAVVMIERSEALRLDEHNRLLAYGAPAIRFRDGFQGYARHGRRIPSRESLQKIKYQKALAILGVHRNDL